MEVGFLEVGSPEVGYPEEGRRAGADRAARRVVVVELHNLDHKRSFSIQARMWEKATSFLQNRASLTLSPTPLSDGGAHVRDRPNRTRSYSFSSRVRRDYHSSSGAVPPDAISYA